MEFYLSMAVSAEVRKNKWGGAIKATSPSTPN